MDLGQMIGDLLEKASLATADGNITIHIACKILIEAFVKGYGAKSDDTAYRVLIRAGVHVINWCARHPGADMSAEVEVMMREAVELIVKAWRRDRDWFNGNLLGCLFARPT